MHKPPINSKYLYGDVTSYNDSPVDIVSDSQPVTTSSVASVLLKSLEGCIAAIEQHIAEQKELECWIRC